MSARRLPLLLGWGSHRVWDFVEDFLEASGGLAGAVIGFGLPMVAAAVAIYSISRGG